MKKGQNIGFLFRSMGLFKITMLASVVFAAFSAILSIYAYTYVYTITEELLRDKGLTGSIDIGLISECGKRMVISVCAAYGLYGVALLFSHITAFNTAVRLKMKLIEHIGVLPGGYHDLNPSGSLRKIIEKNADSAETLIAHQIPNTTMSIVLPVAFVVFMFRYSVVLSIACLIPVVIGAVLLMMIMMGNGSDFVARYQQENKQMAGAAVEYVRGIPVMKTFGQTADSFNRYKRSVEGFCEYVLKFAISMMKGDSAYNTAINSVFLALVPAALIAFRTTDGPTSLICAFVFFASIIPMEVTILKRIMSNSSETIIVNEAMGSIREVLAEKPMEFNGLEVPKHFDIMFKDVSFRYAPELPMVVNNVSFTAAEGSVTALVGSSGGGKSTIASLAARMRDVCSGSIQIGGVDIRNIQKDALHRVIGMVFQESTLLKTSIAENVALYRKDATREEILRALSLAQCNDILAKLPNGIDTVYGSKGTYLSGGEIQRIAIARVILQDPPVIILDEATAFADAENEYLIRKAFMNLREGKTVIMIAHRMSTVRDADNIIVINEGRIEEEGSHERLIAINGIYSAMTQEYKKAVNWSIGGNRKERSLC